MNESELKKIATDKSGWETLFLHIESSSYWEKSYPNSENHGGGLPKLKKIELTELIEKKYGLK